MQGRLRTMGQRLLVLGVIYALVAPFPVWAAMTPDQWGPAWEKSSRALEGAVTDKALLKKVRKAGASSKISARLPKLARLSDSYDAARGKFFNSNSPKDLKQWKKILKQYQKEMHGLAKAKNKYLSSMKKILKSANARGDVKEKYSYQKKTLKAIDAGVRYTYGRNASFLEQNATAPQDGQEMLTRQETMKIKTMKAGLRNGAADIGKGIAKVQSKPKLKTYKKYLFEDIRTVRGLLGECLKIDAIPNPPKSLHKKFSELEKNLQGNKLIKSADKLEQKFRQSRAEAEKMVVQGQIAELDKARKGLKKYVKKLAKLGI